jgi:iron complex outermembrane receptor protein
MAFLYAVIFINNKRGWGVMRKIYLFTIGLAMANAISASAWAKDAPSSDPEFDEILARDISDLKVTSVSKRSQSLQDTAAAIYVITQEDIRRAGIYSIPEALHLVPGMQVAKLKGDSWAISSRGFNSSLDNKLLVLIDGRAIYTPVFSGVYWGDQATSINDIDRIEVIRGPGASLYGANAVNGVINIITKSAEDTQGNLVSATTTNKGNGVYEARHGVKIGNDSFYRGYAQYYDASNWNRKRGGFRVDGKAQGNDSYTVQGDAYVGDQDVIGTYVTNTAPFTQSLWTRDDVYGGNVLGRWNHHIARDSDVSIQAYVDHYARLEYSDEQRVSNADIQAQHTIKLDERNNFIWGGGARLSYLDLKGSFGIDANDHYDLHHILNLFVQDEYALIPKELYFTAGTKLEHNDFTGFEVQPSVRLAWHPKDNQTVWGAISRAVRTPSSIENDVSVAAGVVNVPPVTELRLFGNPDQKSEELIAYELGHRIQVNPNLSFDTALFFNDYDNLQTISTAGTPFLAPSGNLIIPYMFNNMGSGHVYGAEFATSWNVTNNWRLAGSYTYLKMDLDVGPDTNATLESTEKLAPRNQFSIQSYYNVTEDVHWDNMLYYVSHLSEPVDGYVRYDTRIAWLVKPGLEISFIGRNLVDPHTEFPAPSPAEIDRSYIGQVLWKF